MYSSEETPLLLERAGGNGGKTACIAPSFRAEDEVYPELQRIPSRSCWSSICRWRVSYVVSIVATISLFVACSSGRLNYYGSMDYDAARLARSRDVRHHNQQQQHNQDDSNQQREQQIWENLHILEGRIDGAIYYHPMFNSRSSTNDLRDNDDEFARASHVWNERSIHVWNERSISNAIAIDGQHDHDEQKQGQQQPWVVIEVANERDVQLVVPVLVDLQIKHQFPFRVRSGGHNKAGMSTVAKGAVLSLVRLNHIIMNSTGSSSSSSTNNDVTSTASSDAKIVQLGPAVFVQDFIRTILVKHGYGGVTGYCGTVAEGGFILGGGIGIQSRLYGLGLDNAVGMRIVLADGSVHYVSSSSSDDDDVVSSIELQLVHDTTTNMTSSLTQLQKKDLFWGLRGAGGGSFGVVTEIEYRVHKAEDRLLVLSITLEPSDMAILLYRLGVEEPNLPRNLVAMHDIVNTAWLMWSGQNETSFDGAIDYMNELAGRLIPEHAVSYLSQINDYAWSDMYTQHGHHRSNISSTPTWGASCWYGFLLPENNTEIIWRDIMYWISIGTQTSAPYLLPDIELWGGAIHDKPVNATAFPYRDAIYNVGVLLTVPSTDPYAEEIYQREVVKINSWWPRISAHLSGSYVNYPMNSIMSHNTDYARLYWSDNLERLVGIKQRVDPLGSFNFPLGVPQEL